MSPRQLHHFQNNSFPHLFWWQNPRLLWINSIFLSRMLPSSNNYVIIIFNIDSEIMHSELLPSLKHDTRFKGIERTHSTDSDRKWIIITTKASKEAAIVIIDSLIEKSSVPNTNPNKRPGRCTKDNINSTLVNYVAMLQSNIEPTDTTKTIPLLVFRSEISKFNMILHRI